MDAVWRCLKDVHATLQQEAAEGVATAQGLCNEMEKLAFIASLLLLSNVFGVLGNLSHTFQPAQLHLHVLVVEQLTTDAKAALRVIKEIPLHGGYMMELEAAMQAIQVATPLAEASFIENARSYMYIDAIITNLDNRLPQVRTLTLLKSALTNRLKSKTLDHLMRISTEGPQSQEVGIYG